MTKAQKHAIYTGAMALTSNAAKMKRDGQTFWAAEMRRDGQILFEMLASLDAGEVRLTRT